MATDAQAAAQAKMAAMAKAFSIFDAVDPLPTVEQLQGVFKLLKQEPTVEECKGMLNYIKEELAIPIGERIVSPAAVQSKELTPADDTHTASRTHISAGDSLTSSLADHPEITTLQKMYRWAFKEFADRQYHGVRVADGYAWQTYAEVGARATNFAAGLHNLAGLEAKDFLAISMRTRQEWAVAGIAAQLSGFTTVTMYGALGPEGRKHILNQTEATTLVTTADLVQGYLEVESKLKNIVVVGEITDELKEKAGQVTLLAFADVEANGAENAWEAPEVQPEDPSIIVYTSGTTGPPKGVAHAHKNFIANLAGSVARFKFKADDVVFGFLPLAHIYEYIVEISCTYCGASVGYYGGDTKALIADAQALKPTLFIAVPRVLNKIHASVMAKMAANTDPAKKAIGAMAVASKKKGLAQGRVRSLWDFVVFAKIHAILGGRVRLICTGSAPITPDVLGFYRLFFSSGIIEGYGMSEVLVTNTTLISDIAGSGTVGPPHADYEIRLEDIPEMNYSTKSDPPRGEICFRGAAVMQGYYKNEEKTKEVLDEDGWMHSGDVGEWQPNGTIKIIDRKKNIFKLSQGEYVAPNKCENTQVSGSSFVAQSYTHGDSLKPNLVAIIVPDPDYLVPWAKKAGIEGDFAALVGNEKVRDAILEDINTTGRAAGLKGFEIPKAITLHGEAFTAESGLLTPTFKLKRRAVQEKFQADIDRMYASLE